jgi:hypothetical protein
MIITEQQAVIRSGSDEHHTAAGSSKGSWS